MDDVMDKAYLQFFIANLTVIAEGLDQDPQHPEKAVADLKVLAEAAEALAKGTVPGLRVPPQMLIGKAC